MSLTEEIQTCPLQFEPGVATHAANRRATGTGGTGSGGVVVKGRRNGMTSRKTPSTSLTLVARPGAKLARSSSRIIERCLKKTSISLQET